MSIVARLVIAAFGAATAALPASAQTVRLERLPPTLVEVTGGTGASSWRLRYGSSAQTSGRSLLFIASPTRAYFVHGSWLRLIDTDAGQVVGRWRFPFAIEELSAAANGAVNVRFGMSPQSTMRSVTVTFDPVNPVVPEWDIGGLITFRTSELESFERLRHATGTPDPWLQVMPGAASEIPLMEDLVRRDPSAPMLRLGLAKLLRDAGDVRAGAVFREMFTVTSNDFTEWFRIASILLQMPDVNREMVQAAYDRGFSDFIRRDRDPRLVDTLIGRLILFPPGSLTAADESRRRYYLDLAYRLAPMSEGTDRAWLIHAEALARQGEGDASLWRERAAQVRHESLFIGSIDHEVRHDQLLLVAIGSVAAAFLFMLTRSVKYGPQRRMQAVASVRSGRRPRTLFGFRYWSWRERTSLLLVAVLAWCCLALAWAYLMPTARAWMQHIHVGSLNAYERFDSYPVTPERTLLQAIALQHTGMIDEADRLYRSVPQFAQSWNNIGVMLDRAGKTDEGRQAFARAREIDPTLAEAVFNTTGEAHTVVVQTFKRYGPGRKMIALPSREQMLRAYLGDAWTQRYWRVWRAPFDVLRQPRFGFASGTSVTDTTAAMAIVVIVVLAIATLQVLLTRVDATVPPGPRWRWIELAIPGTSSVWQWTGALVLAAGFIFLIAIVLEARFQSPYMLTALVTQPGVMRAFGYSVGSEDLDPPMALMIGGLIAIWIVNAVVVVTLSRRSATSAQ